MTRCCVYDYDDVPVRPHLVTTPVKAKPFSHVQSAYSSTVTRKLATLRLEAARHAVNQGVRVSKTSRQVTTPLHPALAYHDTVENRRGKARVAGPAAPTSWTTMMGKASRPGGARGEVGRAERRRLKPTAFVRGDGHESAGVEARLAMACARVVARALANDEAMREVVHLLPTHLKTLVMHVAAIEEPLSNASVIALLCVDHTSEAEHEFEQEADEEGEEWETMDDQGNEDDAPLEYLDLRFSTLTTATLLATFFSSPDDPPRLPALTHLDLSYAHRLHLPDLLDHFPRLLSLVSLSIVGLEGHLQAEPGGLRRLALATPHLIELETGDGLAFSSWSQLSWSTTWRKLDRLVVVCTDSTSTTWTATALREAVKAAGRTRWLDVMIAPLSQSGTDAQS